MTKSTHGGKRKGAGRAPEYDTRTTVRLTAAQAEIARKLGDGDVSAGIRATLDFFEKSEKPRRLSPSPAAR